MQQKFNLLLDFTAARTDEAATSASSARSATACDESASSSSSKAASAATTTASSDTEFDQVRRGKRGVGSLPQEFLRQQFVAVKIEQLQPTSVPVAIAVDVDQGLALEDLGAALTATINYFQASAGECGVEQEASGL